LSVTFSAGAGRRLEGAAHARLMKNHDWRQIAQHTIDVYVAALPQGRHAPHRDPLST
jgi:hypothetical protein